MRASVCRAACAALAATSALAMLAMTTHAADYCCVPAYVPTNPSRFACTEPAPPSRFPPAHIPNPFARDSPNCDPGFGGNPYGRGPIPLPPPPGMGSFGTPYNTNPFGTSPFTSPFGSAPGTGTLTPREGPPSFQHSRTLGGTTRFVEETQPLCKVTFWNHTPAELTLFVGDRRHQVQPDRAIVLTLPREFTWKTDVHADRPVQVPGDLNYFDVVIR